MSEKPAYEDLEQRILELEQSNRNRKQTEKARLESKQRYERLVNTIPCALYDYIRFADGRNRFIYISPQCRQIFEQDADRIIDDSNLLWGMVHPEDVERLKQEDVAAHRTGELFQSEVRIVLPDGRIKWIQLTSMPGTHHVGSQVIWSGVILDITERKQAKEEKNQWVSKPQLALAEIKTLKGIVPICSFCKKVRDDQGYWEQVEVYVKQHTQADFSHGICPECAQKHYPGMRLYDDDETPCRPPRPPA